MTVKEDGKEVVYYFDTDTNKMFPHPKYCKGTKEAKVTITKTEEKDGKKYAEFELLAVNQDGERSAFATAVAQLP